MVVATQGEIVPAPIAAPVVAPPRLNFRNGTAVKTGLSVAAVASLLSALPAMAAGMIGLGVWWLAAGYLAVYFYRRRTGVLVNVDGGLRMGWITGLLGSTITCVLFTASVALVVWLSQYAASHDDNFRQMMQSDPRMQEVLKIVQSPNALPALVGGLLFSFLLITFLCTAGGALGAKLAPRQRAGRL